MVEQLYVGWKGTACHLACDGMMACGDTMDSLCCTLTTCISGLGSTAPRFWLCWCVEGCVPVLCLQCLHLKLLGLMRTLQKDRHVPVKLPTASAVCCGKQCALEWHVPCLILLW
jgi:hypothetical protein